MNVKDEELQSIGKTRLDLERANKLLEPYVLNLNRVPRKGWRVYGVPLWLPSGTGPTYILGWVGLGVIADWINSPVSMAQCLLEKLAIPLPPTGSRNETL